MVYGKILYTQSEETDDLSENLLSLTGESTMEKREKVSFIHSISAKVTFLTIGIVALSVLVSMINASLESKSVVSNVYSEYILTMAETASDVLETIPEEACTLEEYENVLGDVRMEGIESGYAYLVASDGTMLYHPTADKIGKPVENAVVSGIVEELQAGHVPEDEIVLYEFNGTMKYAAYSINERKQIVVVTADQEEILAPVNKMIAQMGYTSIAILVVCIIVGYVVSVFICNPIKKLTVIIGDTAQLDFRSNPDGVKLRARKDESGAMARAIHLMRANLRKMIKDIDSASDQITTNVDGLQQITTTVDHMCSDNSATSQELAAGMQETAATTVTINENINVIKNGAEDINTMAAEGAKTSEEVMNRARDLRTKTVTASAKTMDMYNNVKVKAEHAIEGSKAVEKINELTGTIMEISSQTGLLALNASIEAARAGEAGRGFAVVATEIGSLADQTSKAIADISEIVKAVNEAVANMAECLEETTVFLENTVLTEYKGFEAVSEQYEEDADVFKTSMNDVREAMAGLANSIEAIAQALSGINDTVGESSIGVTDIAEKTSDMVEKTGTTHDMVSECYECVENLRQIVQRFVLE